MYGIVLWSDVNDRSAVIWCEDHGDLAFLQHDRFARGAPLEAGDWVRFEVTVAGRMRLARSVELVENGAARALPRCLAEAAMATSDGIEGSRQTTERVVTLHGKVAHPRHGQAAPQASSA